jgi:hypothetical protein
MKPDTPSFGDSGDAALEAKLRALPPPGLPPSWRAPILRAAREPVWPWFTRPVRYGLAVCWAAIAGFHFTTPPGPDPLPAGSWSPPPARALPPDFDEPWLADIDPSVLPPP